MSTLAIQFELPVQFPVKLNNCRLVDRPAWGLEEADPAVILGEERAVGVDRLGFAPAAAAWPERGRDDFWWSSDLSSVTNIQLTKSDSTNSPRENGGGDSRRSTG